MNTPERLLEKVSEFVRGLDEEERMLFAALLAPGVAAAHQEPEVEGFGVVAWRPSTLPDALAAAVRERGMRIVGLDD
jgi:hypothetical protein